MLIVLIIQLNLFLLHAYIPFYSTDPAQPGQLNLTASDLSAPDITLRWGASPGFVDRYKIQITGHDGDLYTTGNETEIPVTGLESGRQYEIRISAESYGRTGLGRVENITTDSERKCCKKL